MECSFKSQRFFRRYDVIVEKIPRRRLAEKEIDTEKGKERVYFWGLVPEYRSSSFTMSNAESFERFPCVSLFLERNV